MAEGLLRSLSNGEIEAFSAGTEPSSVHALAIEVMRAEGIDITAQRSKHLEEYIADDFDFVITVCDLAGASCPSFPGRAERLHWSIPDPSGVAGSATEKEMAFRDAAAELRARIRTFLDHAQGANRSPNQRDGGEDGPIAKP